MVCESGENHAIKTKGNQKSILECVAKYNLKGQCPTQKKYLTDLKLSGENLKKIMQRICKMGLVIIHPEKIGNEHQYVLSHMQDIVKVNKTSKRNGTVKEQAEEVKRRRLHWKTIREFLFTNFKKQTESGVP